MVDSVELRRAIAAILTTADLTSVTAKKVRLQLEKELGLDLEERKKEIDDIVMELVNEKESEKEESEEEGGKRNGRKRKSEDEGKGRKKKAKPSSASSSSTGPKKPGTGFTRTLNLSPELAKLMGKEQMARHEVVKQMWAMIKEKNLYDPKNKQFAICNEEMLAVFGVKRFRTFGMMKYLKNHFLD